MSPRRDAPPWLERAEEARMIAERTTDPDARRAMVRIAENYEQLARLYDPPRSAWGGPNSLR